MSARSLSFRIFTVVRIFAVCWALAMAAFTFPVQAGPMYWTGYSSGGASWTAAAGGTNWSTDPNTLADPGAFPGISDDVYFVFASGAKNFNNTILGQNFSINSLNFTADASAPVGIGGGNTLTLGAGGLTVLSGALSATLSTNVAIGSAQTWTENSASSGSNVNVSGVLSGSAPVTLRGTGSTTTPSGAFIFSGSDTYSGALTLLNANTSLTLSGNGALPSASGITLDGGSSLIFDNTASAAAAARLGSTVPVTSNGGSITLKGNASASVGEQVGVLTLGSGLVTSGATNLTVTDSGQSTALTIASIARQPGSTINVSTSTNSSVALTTSTLNSSNILGGWATVGNLAAANETSNALDWATVSNGKIVPLPSASYNTGAFTTWGTSDNVKVNNSSGTLTANQTIGTLYMTGPGSLALNGKTLTIGAGGIIANDGSLTGTITASAETGIGNCTEIGTTGLNGGVSGTITVGTGTPDLVVSVSLAGSVSMTSAAGALQLNSVIADAANPTGTFAATTTSGTNVITLTTGTTSQLCIGTTVTGLAGGLSGTQTITGIIDSTHFTVANNATSSVSGTPAFTSHTGLTKTGPGILDLSNNNNAQTTNTFTGPLTVDGGIITINNDLEMGSGTAAFNPAAIVLNGGEIRSTKGINLNVNRGITVGPQGGAFTYEGGATLTFVQVITGPGGMTFRSIGTGTTFNISNTTTDTYQGPTYLDASSPANNNNLTWGAQRGPP